MGEDILPLLVDNRCVTPNVVPAFSLAEVLPALQANKIYAFVLDRPGIPDATLELADKELLNDEISDSRARSTLWGEATRIVTEVLTHAGVEFCLIKTCLEPWSTMVDIDVLVEKGPDRAVARQALEQIGFVFHGTTVLGFRIRGGEKALGKLERPEITPGTMKDALKAVSGVDLYSCPPHSIVGAQLGICERRRPLKLFGQFETFVPTLEDDFVITALHTFGHGFVTLSDILHCLGLWELGIDTRTLHERALNSGATVQTVCLGVLISKYAEQFRSESQLARKRAFREYGRPSSLAGELVEKIDISFPFFYSPVLSLLSATARFRESALSGGIYGLAYDLGGHAYSLIDPVRRAHRT